MPDRPLPSSSRFHPLVETWFAERIGAPTAVQNAAWPLIAAGEHLLVSAPTGSGKTLTAFLWALDQLLTGAWQGERLRVLYISPLKALNNDIRKNLLQPLAELEESFAAAGEDSSAVRVGVRSGDTPERERRAMLRHPPEILITTPESLNLLLTSPRGRRLFSSLKAVILDEIHAVAANKRGVHLMTAVERLVPLAGEFQRLALSATVRPRERMARFVGGYRRESSRIDAGYIARRVEVVESEEAKRYELKIDRPVAAAEADLPGSEFAANLWESLTVEFKRRIHDRRSTLLFANNRRTTERLSRLLNEGEQEGFAYSHHGSLSREIRTLVEERMKEGKLKAIVATNSLELGIDVGAIDEVLMVKTPPTVASAVQRIGRAGHRVGETSRARIYPLFDRDLLEAVVVADAVRDHDIEEVRPIEGPLDVLAQIILSMTAGRTWPVEELFEQLRASYSYHNLTRRQFELVLEMLAGRYSATRVRELTPRLSWDKIDDTVSARPGSARLVYLSGGTIPDRGYYQLRLLDGSARLGELDEEFVWERSLGDTFTLGAQTWKIRKITHSDVFVSPARRSAAMAPFWRAEERDRSFHLSNRIGEFLASAERALAATDGIKTLKATLLASADLDEGAAQALIDLLVRQRAATGTPLPHRRHLLLEEIDGIEGNGGEPDRRRLLLHTGWGGRVHRPWTIALAAAWEKRYTAPLEIEHNNDCVLLTVPRDFDASELWELVLPENVETLLRKRLQETGFFGARFRENAGRALLLPRSGVRRRVPLWLQRERSKKLLRAVRGFEDFPVVVETWRTCLQDEFELEALKALLTEVAEGQIRVSEVMTSTPSPFAADLIWKQTNRLMYEDDTPEGDAAATISNSLLRELVFSPRLRPQLPPALLAEFRSKLQRIYPGYAPGTAADLVAWVKERLLVDANEWQELLAAVQRDVAPQSNEFDEVLRRAAKRLVRISLGVPAVIAAEVAPRLVSVFGVSLDSLQVAPLIAAEEPAPIPVLAEAPQEDEQPMPIARKAGLIGEWLRYHGPIERTRIAQSFGLPESEADEIVTVLVDEELVVVGDFHAGPDAAGGEVCDTENLERLLRIHRARMRPSFSALPLERLPLFLAVHQGIAGGDEGIDGLRQVLDRMIAFPASARVWEEEILPARLVPYYPEWLDQLLLESDLFWYGCGKERATFLFPADLDLAGGPRSEPVEAPGTTEGLFPRPGYRRRFEELLEESDFDSQRLAETLWDLAWQGEVTNTTMLSLRKGLLGRFKVNEIELRPAHPPARRGRLRFDRWRAARPFGGEWYRLEPPVAADDPLQGEEHQRERARLLLDRYGVLFRELVARELPAFRWGELFRALRLMELSGEVLTGHFFTGISGPQFASRAAFKRLSNGLPEDPVYWLNATDPASPCGLGLDSWKGEWPARLPSNHLVFHGDRPVLLAQRNGGELELRVAPDHPELPRFLEFLRVRLARRFNPVRAIDVERINGRPAVGSDYETALREQFAVTRERDVLRLRRRY